MYSFLPALTPILELITCTQRNTSPYVVVSGVELISGGSGSFAPVCVDSTKFYYQLN